MRIAVPDLVSNSYFPAVTAVELGLFRAEGLDCQLQHIYPVSEAMSCMREGLCDLVAGPAHATLRAFPNWEGAKLLCALAQYTYWFLVLRSDLGARRGDIQSVKGLRIGAAPGPEASLRRMLIEAGIDLERDQVQLGPVKGVEGEGTSFGVAAARALEEGSLDGFWANGMGAEVAVKRGVGTVIIDARRGDGPPAAKHYTFAALVAPDRLIKEAPDMAAAAVRAIVRAQKALREDPSLATEVGRRLFPPYEAALIEEVVRRDLPYYDATITQEAVDGLNRFSLDLALISESVPYDRVVAAGFQQLWSQ